ncbi:unnamed protein product [Vicia faba]|uniref:Uncharacterized protein n=1 Tax=Vicia faba TaxID=3906 RepID=A0AAV0YC01_VICFA|nr:unnamed protein product [Vicia faba]
MPCQSSSSSVHDLHIHTKKYKSIQAIMPSYQETGDEGYNIDAAHLSIMLADHGVLSEGAGTGKKLGAMDAYAEVATIVRQYGSMYLRLGDLQMALEYYTQAAAAVGGGQLSWTGRGNVDQQNQRNFDAEAASN